MNDSRLSWQVRARATWALFAVFFLFPTLYVALDNPVGYEESETLMVAKQFAEPELLPDDWYLNHPQPVRVPYQLLVYPLVKLLPLPAVSVLARMLGFAIVALGLALIARRLRLDAVQAAVIIGAYLALDQSFVPAQEWIFKKTESKVPAYGLVLIALAALASGRLRVCALIAGLATTMHVIVGGWGTMALGLTVLSQGTGAWRERIEALVLWAVGAGAALYMVWLRLGGPAASTGFDPASIYVFFRMPHHLDPSYWGWSDEDTWMTILAAVLVAALLRAARGHPAGGAGATVARFALFTLVPYVLGLVVFLTPLAASFLNYYPFRMASTVIMLLGLMIAVPVLMRFVFREPARRWVAGVAAAYFAVFVVEGFAHEWGVFARLPEGGYWRSVNRTKHLVSACEWVKRNTDRDARLIASPYLDVALYHCRRPVVVTFRMAPSDPAGIEEWYSRLIDFNGGRRPRERGYRAGRELDRNFDRLPVSTYRELAAKYDGDYLLVRDRDDLRLPRVYRNATWSVYRLGE